MIRSTLLIGALAMSGAVAQAAIVEHNGANNPTTEGWTFDTLGAGSIVTGPILNDAGSGYDAWMVNDNAANDYGAYFYAFTAGDLTALSGQNWTAAMRMRQPELSTGGDGDVYMDVHFGPKRFLVYFGTQADGNPTWTLYNDIPRAINGLGAGYHLYELRYDATTTLADFYVDGQLAVDDYNGGGLTPGTQRIAFGSASGAGTDQGNYNLVTMTLDPIPEPAALSLVAMGSLAGLGRRRR